MRAQAFSEKQSMGMMMSQKTMELNPSTSHHQRIVDEGQG